jgi:hypothetical protein
MLSFPPLCCHSFYHQQCKILVPSAEELTIPPSPLLFFSWLYPPSCHFWRIKPLPQFDARLMTGLEACGRFISGTEVISSVGHAVAVVVSRWPVTVVTRFKPRSCRVEFVVDKVALRQVLSQHFGFTCHSFHRLFQTCHHLSSETATIGEIVASVPSGLSNHTRI